MIAHQAKKMNEDSSSFATDFKIPVSDQQLKDIGAVRRRFAGNKILEGTSRRARRAGRRSKSDPIEIPPLSAFGAQLKSTGEREISTTMAFVRILMTSLLRDKAIGKRIVPIVPDESTLRHGGYVPPVRHLLASRATLPAARRRRVDVLSGGQDRANSTGGDQRAWRHGLVIAAATSYSTSNTAPMIPFDIYYSMFGF